MQYLKKIFQRRTNEEKRVSRLLFNSNAINTTAKLSANKPTIHGKNDCGLHEIKEPLTY